MAVPSRLKPAWRWSVLVSVLGLVAGACGSSSGGGPSSGGTNTASAPGITPSTITIGSHQPLTGVASAGYSEIAPASKAMFDYVNSKGGVFGRKIIYNYQDDAYDPSQTVSVVRKLVLQDNVFAIFNGLGTPTHLAVQQFLNTERVPDLFVASGCDCWNDPSRYPYTSGWQPNYTIEGKIMGMYIKSHFPGERVAYFYQNDEFGQDGVKGLDQQIPASEVVSRQHYDIPNLVVDPQIGAIQAAHAQVVVLYTVPAYTALAIKAAQKIGFHPQWVISDVGADVPTLKGLFQGQDVGSILQGTVTNGYLPAISDTSNPWIQLFMRIHDRYIPNLPFDGNVEYGMAVAYTFVKLLEQAGRNPTRQSIIKTLQTANLAGPQLAPFDYSAHATGGMTGVQMGTITGGKLVLSGPVYVSSTNGPITVYTGSQSSPPPNF
jgi:ABC-type branched-subunit amino acid transport system substrate-binding protein